MHSFPPDAERRRAPRYDVLVQVRVHYDDTDLVMLIKNVSQSGALIDMGQVERPSWLALGHEVELTFVIPDSTRSFDFGATVVRLTEDLRYRHFAVQFREVSAAGAEFISQLVQAAGERAGPPPLPPPPLPGTKKA